MISYNTNKTMYEINTVDASYAISLCATRRQTQSQGQASRQKYGEGMDCNSGHKVLAGTNSRDLGRNKVCPSCFMSTLSVSPDEWVQCLDSLELMISTIINDITTQES